MPLSEGWVEEGGGGVILECLGGSEGGGAYLLKETRGSKIGYVLFTWFPISWNLTVFQTQTVKICIQFQKKPYLLKMHINSIVHINQNMEKEKNKDL